MEVSLIALILGVLAKICCGNCIPMRDEAPVVPQQAQEDIVVNINVTRTEAPAIGPTETSQIIQDLTRKKAATSAKRRKK